MTDQERIIKLEEKIVKLENLLKKHTHSGLETFSRIEPKTIITNSMDVKVGYSVLGTAGVSGTFNTADANKAITVVKGIITSIV